MKQVIFLSGFSTSSTVNRLSGRGVGLDVVKSEIEAMRGAVEVESTTGRGTRFILTLPLTLTLLRTVLVRAGGRIFAFDTSSIERMVRIDPADLRVANGCHVLPLGDDLIRVISLSHILGVGGTQLEGRVKIPIVSLSYGQRRAAFLVEDLLSEQEVVIRPFGPRALRVAFFSGATTLLDGTVVPILNAVDLIDRALSAGAGDAMARPTAPAAAAVKRIIVVDDSVTTRTLEKSILESAGYEVIAAADGAEAWKLLNQEAADLVVSDVEMPNMDGFSLTEAIRRSTQFRELPVILVTARGSEEDRLRGLEAGANAYIVKSSFDQKLLLDAVERVI